MKPEKEFVWMVNLFNSPYLKKSIFKKQKVALKRDFEKIANASENSKDFRNWINELIDIKIIENIGSKKVYSREWSVYVINGKLLEKKIIKSPLFNDIQNVIDDITNRII